MKLLCFLSVLAVISACVLAEEEKIVEKVEESSTVVVPSTLIDVDAGVKDDGDVVRQTRQFRTFGFGRPYGGGFYRPRPYYGGGFYRPRPYYGGGFYRPRPYYGGGGFYGGGGGGGFYPSPYYGGFYG